MRIRGNWSTKFTLFAVINFIHNFLQFMQYCFLNLLNSWSDTSTSQKCYTLRSPSKLPILIVIRGISLSQAVFVIPRLPAVFVFLLAKVWRTWAVVEFWNKSLYVFYLQRSHAHVDFAVANMLPSRNNFDLLDDQLTKQYKVSKLENRTSRPISRPRFFFLPICFDTLAYTLSICSLQPVHESSTNQNEALPIQNSFISIFNYLQSKKD